MGGVGSTKGDVDKSAKVIGGCEGEAGVVDDKISANMKSGEGVVGRNVNVGRGMRMVTAKDMVKFFQMNQLKYKKDKELQKDRKNSTRAAKKGTHVTKLKIVDENWHPLLNPEGVKSGQLLGEILNKMKMSLVFFKYLGVRGH